MSAGILLLESGMVVSGAPIDSATGVQAKLTRMEHLKSNLIAFRSRPHLPQPLRARYAGSVLGGDAA
jgi:hypothetical protein